MAKKAERKAREEAERRSSGVRPQGVASPPPPSGAEAAVPEKSLKKAARAARGGNIGTATAAAAEGKPGA